MREDRGDRREEPVVVGSLDSGKMELDKRIKIIEDAGAPELDAFARLTGRQLRSCVDPDKGLFIVESPIAVRVALKEGHCPEMLLCETRLAAKQVKDIIDECFAANPAVKVCAADREILRSITGFELTRGVLCAMKRPPAQDCAELLKKVCKGKSRIAVLEGITDATNVGAIFRCAAALNIDAVIVTPTCSDPLTRRSVRVSMGTILQVPWAVIGKNASDWPEKGLKILKDLGFKTAAMALSDDSVPIDDPSLAHEERLAIVLGTEGDGLSPDTVASCDYTVRIPMSHGVDSLNVAAAAAVAFWELRIKAVGQLGSKAVGQ